MKNTIAITIALILVGCGTAPKHHRNAPPPLPSMSRQPLRAVPATPYGASVSWSYLYPQITNGATVIGYNLYSGTASHSYSLTNFVAGYSNRSFILSNLLANTVYYLNATAVATNGIGTRLESVYCAEASYIDEVPPLPTTNIVITAQMLSATKVIGPWVAIGPSLSITNPVGDQFFKVGIAKNAQ